MNTHSNSTAEPAPATPQHRMEIDNLSMEGLHGLHEVISMTAEMLQGMICQPRFSTGGGGTLNEAGEVLDHLIEHLFECRTAIVASAEDKSPTDPCEAEHRAWLILQGAVVYRDSLPKIAAMAAQLVATQSSVEFRSRRAAV